MIITFLGTGTSQGVPIIGCDCEVCSSIDFRDKRLRTSLYIQYKGKHLIFDSGPDFRTQALREKIPHLDALIFTHEHKDHTAGLDDVRPYYFRDEKNIQVYGRANVLQQLKKEFAYMFSEVKYPGVPAIDLHEINNSPFQIGEILLTPIEVMHYKLPVFGFRLEDFSYITDANHISDNEMEKLKGTKILVINALQKTDHISHFKLEEALDIIDKIKPQKAYLIHMSHKMGKHAKVERELPENIHLAYDGLKIKI